jgi:hypothetical protein
VAVIQTGRSAGIFPAEDQVTYTCKIRCADGDNGKWKRIDFFALLGKMDNRTGTDRRKASPFGTHGPWLTTGKMGGLVFTDRRKARDRRIAHRQEESVA